MGDNEWVLISDDVDSATIVHVAEGDGIADGLVAPTTAAVSPSEPNKSLWPPYSEPTNEAAAATAAGEDSTPTMHELGGDGGQREGRETKEADEGDDDTVPGALVVDDERDGSETTEADEGDEGSLHGKLLSQSELDLIISAAVIRTAVVDSDGIADGAVPTAAAVSPLEISEAVSPPCNEAIDGHDDAAAEEDSTSAMLEEGALVSDGEREWSDTTEADEGGEGSVHGALLSQSELDQIINAAVIRTALLGMHYGSSLVGHEHAAAGESMEGSSDDDKGTAHSVIVEEETAPTALATAGNEAISQSAGASRPSTARAPGAPIARPSRAVRLRTAGVRMRLRASVGGCRGREQPRAVPFQEAEVDDLVVECVTFCLCLFTTCILSCLILLVA